MKEPGTKPPQSGPFGRELIGPPQCPLFIRWTLYDAASWRLLFHRFMPYADDRDPHDHPRAFVTLVVQGGYTDIAEVPCVCQHHSVRDGGLCHACSGRGYVFKRDRLRLGSIRFRSATHRHRTRVGPRGCMTLVLMGPLRRPWGFWREGRWWPWKEYETTFGYGMRCPDE